MASVENGAAGASRRPAAPPGAEASRVGVNLLGAGVTEGTGVPGGRCPWGQGRPGSIPMGSGLFSPKVVARDSWACKRGGQRPGVPRVPRVPVYPACRVCPTCPAKGEQCEPCPGTASAKAPGLVRRLTAAVSGAFAKLLAHEIL